MRVFNFNKPSARERSVLSESVCILLRNTNTISPRILFFKASVLVQLAFRKAAPTSIVAQSCVFILAGGEHTPELRISTDPHGSRPLFSTNAMQEGIGWEGRGTTLPKTAQRKMRTGPDLIHRSEFISAPTLHSEWPRAIKA